MDPLNLVRVSLLSLETGVPDNTRIARPRLQDKPAASTPNGNIKLKGIIVGNYFIVKNPPLRLHCPRFKR